VRDPSQNEEFVSQDHMGDAWQSKNGQTHTYKHTIPYMKFKLKLLHFNCHVLEFYIKSGSSKRLL
jgi:hypothetical protein